MTQMKNNTSIITFLVLSSMCLVDGFLSIHCNKDSRFRHRCPTATHLIEPLSVSAVSDPYSSLTLAEESWRQYVPLVVSAGVMVDILLGSPLANMALKPMRDGVQDDTEGEGIKTRAEIENKSKERIDSEKFAQEAIDRAQNALELRKFLEEQKSDWDKMEEIKRKLDSEMQDLDEDLKAREDSLAARRNKQN